MMSEHDCFMPSIPFLYEGAEFDECRKVVTGLVESGLWPEGCENYFHPSREGDWWKAAAFCDGFVSAKLQAKLNKLNARDRRFAMQDMAYATYQVNISATSEIEVRITDTAYSQNSFVLRVPRQI